MRWCACIAAALAIALPALGQPAPLPVDKAFRFTARALNPETVEARFAIADGYYLYRDRIHFSVDPADAGLVVPVLPEGKVKEDQFFGRVETYRGSITVNLGIKNAAVGQKVVIQAESQGCWDFGICYPPQIQRVAVPLNAATAVPARGGEPTKKGWLE
jgi:thiol:disulfide interchange protein DsbD